MFWILDTTTNLVNTCSSPILARILNLIKTSLNIIQIIGPILAMIALVLNFTKLTTNPDEKKYKKGLINSLIATVMLFLLPAIINLTMSLLGNTFTISSCWNNLENITNVEQKNDYISDCKCKKNAITNQMICPDECDNCPKECPKKSNEINKK